MKEKMYICKSESEMIFVKEHFLPINKYSDAFEKRLKQFNNQIYIFQTPTDVEYCETNVCGHCPYDCFNNCEVIYVNKLLREDKLKRILK